MGVLRRASPIFQLPPWSWSAFTPQLFQLWVIPITPEGAAALSQRFAADGGAEVYVAVNGCVSGVGLKTKIVQ